jgi:hypothetical protein
VKDLPPPSLQRGKTRIDSAQSKQSRKRNEGSKLEEISNFDQNMLKLLK